MSLGINSKVYRNTGTYGSPTWASLDDISDCKVGNKWKLAEGSTRGSPLVQQEPTMIELGVTGKIRASGGTDYLAMQTAYYARTLVDVLVLDGGSTTNGAEGNRYDCKITQWDEDQGLNNVNYRDFALTPCILTNVPKSVIVTSGSPVFTSIT